MKKSLYLVGLLGACTGATACVAQAPSEVTPNSTPKRPPNIIFVLADDLGYGDLSCYGQKHFTTPNIDKLAKDGVRFTQFYSTSPVCAPARCAILTGKHSGHATIRSNGEHRPEGQVPMLETDFTIAEMLKTRGYATGCVGKWGLGYVGSVGDPNARGFDFFYGVNCQREAHFYYPDHAYRNRERIDFPQNVPNKGGPDYLPDHLIAEAKSFIQANKDTPFFLWYTTPIPHASLQVKENELAKFKGKFKEKPFRESHYAGQPYPCAAAATMVTRLDSEVGDMKKLCQDLGIDDNTIFIFASDNGPSREGGKDVNFFNSNGGVKGGKTELFEGGVRIPMIVSAPKYFKKGTVSNDIFSFQDLMRTFADFTQTESDKIPADGISFYPTLVGKKSEQKQHDFLYWEYMGIDGQVAVRSGNMKAVATQAKKTGTINLKIYDLEKDPKEKNDIAAQNPDLVKSFLQKIQQSHEKPVLKQFNFEAIEKLKVQ